ncbi:type II CAAX prenyl endopeptidase Rce1 family protein [Gemmatimonadota bacterium]
MRGWWKERKEESFQQTALNRNPDLWEVTLLLGFIMALLLLVSFSLIEVPHLSLPGEINSRFIAVLIIELMFVGLPVAGFIWVKRFDPSRVLGLNPTGVASLGGAALMGAATVLIAPQLEAWQARVIPPPEQYLEALSEFVTLEPGESLVWALFCLALVPAICEETLFRGVLLKTCLARWDKVTAIVGIGILFGIFHLDLWRWPLLSLIGMLITWIAVETASIWPAFVFHLVNNSVSLLFVNFNWPVERDAVDLPPELMAVGVGFLVIGAGFIIRESGRIRSGDKR